VGVAEAAAWRGHGRIAAALTRRAIPARFPRHPPHGATMRQDLPLFLCAVHSFGFAAFHLAFWRLFGWKRELAKVGLPTRAITQILNLRLVYVFAGIGAACLWLPHELRGTPLGRALLGFMVLFWVGRTIEQFVFLPVDRPLVHALTALFVLGAVLFAIPLLPA